MNAFNVLAWWKNNGSATTFTRKDVRTTFLHLGDVRVADVNHDGQLDLVVLTGSTVKALLGYTGADLELHWWEQDVGTGLENPGAAGR